MCNINIQSYAQDISEVPNVKKDSSTTSIDVNIPAEIIADKPLLMLSAPDGLPIRELNEGLPVDPEDEADEEMDSIPKTKDEQSIPVTFNIETKEEIINGINMNNHEPFNEILQIPYTDGGMGEEIYDSNQINKDELLNFSGLSLVSTSSLTSYPYRLAVKIKSFNTDTTGGHWLSSCSGTLIDPTHVITCRALRVLPYKRINDV